MALRCAIACFLLLAACADDRPPGVDLSASVSTTSVDDEDDADDERPATVHLPCVAGETRACKIVWRSVDEPGIQHCRTAQQVCRDDGRGWRACGDVGEPE